MNDPRQDDSDPFEQGEQALARRITHGLSKVGLALRTHAWQEAAPRGLTPTQGQVLAFLRARPGGARLSAIADGLAVTAPTASDAVAALVEKRLVTKRRAPDDARAVLVGLTSRGRREAERAAAWPDVLLGAVDALRPDEQEVFLRGLVRMVGALQERGQVPVSRMCVTCRYFRPRVHDDPARPHHCAFVDAPMGDRHLRLDCPEQEPAPDDEAARAFAAWSADPSPDPEEEPR
ncbi:MAG: MarR family winged helix-turn-helix transcriptional regulator [Planctomycetes bacterium]|nr:MarR family winged helix-turn-helix transcriptional regulator [Planctomycetota bacterium]